MVLQQLENVLSRYHCQRIAALHQPFDPHLHEAISQQPSDEFPSQTVLLVVQPGYQLFERLHSGHFRLASSVIDWNNSN